MYLYSFIWFCLVFIFSLQQLTLVLFRFDHRIRLKSSKCSNKSSKIANVKNRNSVSFYGLRLVPFWVCERGTYTMNMGTVKKLYLQRKFATLNGYSASIWIFSLSNLHLWNGIFNRILQFSFVIPTSFGVLHQKIVIIGCNFVGIAVKWRVCIAIFAYGHNIRYFIRYRSIDGGNGGFTITLAHNQCKQMVNRMVFFSFV